MPRGIIRPSTGCFRPSHIGLDRFHLYNDNQQYSVKFISYSIETNGVWEGISTSPEKFRDSLSPPVKPHIPFDF